MISIRRHLHKYPETSYDEFQSAEFIKEKLSELGIESTGGQGGTGVTAYLGNGASGEGCVALRADMDALPIREQTGLGFSSVHEGVMHACGHDGHVAMLLGAAAILKKSFSGPGRVKLIFQPAEEGPPEGEKGGASLMLEEGIWSEGKPEAIFGIHVGITTPGGQISTRPGPLMAAADRYKLIVKGQQSHGARPWDGVDPIVVASQIVLGFQTHN